MTAPRVGQRVTLSGTVRTVEDLHPEDMVRVTIDVAPDRPHRIPIDFGDLLIAVADDVDEIRRCIGCGEASTWAGFFVHDDGTVTATSWCDAAGCEQDRLVGSAEQSFALPIDHMPHLRQHWSDR